MSEASEPKPPSLNTAVALRYDGTGAPRVTAKGDRDLANRIIELANQHQIPIHEDQDLVAVLSTVSLGDQIPESLYRAVAEILAFAYQLRLEQGLAAPPGLE